MAVAGVVEHTTLHEPEAKPTIEPVRSKVVGERVDHDRANLGDIETPYQREVHHFRTVATPETGFLTYPDV